jgi:hypothetical protein
MFLKTVKTLIVRSLSIKNVFLNYFFETKIVLFQQHSLLYLLLVKIQYLLYKHSHVNNIHILICVQARTTFILTLEPVEV